MSSETSTESQPAFEPWQLFTLAGLIGATIAVFMARGESPAAVIMISLTIFAAAAVGIAALRTFLPLTQKAPTDAARILGGRTRAALEREKTLLLRSIKELEFDRAMGKVSEKDFVEMSGRLRARAARLMRQLDAGAGYRSEIEREIVKRIGEAPAGSEGQARAGSTRLRAEGASPSVAEARKEDRQAEAEDQEPPYAADQRSRASVEGVLPSRPAVTCASCTTANDSDARFCKHCGHSLEARS
jgi:hypothetical protein